jgi:RecA-family ATPase
MGKAVLNLDGLKKTEDKPENSPFILRSGNERTNFAKKLVMPKMIMGELLYEQTVTMLFAETGVGKSMLAFQLANAITKGRICFGVEE